jgi:hypothetical protein
VIIPPLVFPDPNILTDQPEVFEAETGNGNKLWFRKRIFEYINDCHVLALGCSTNKKSA